MITKIESFEYQGKEITLLQDDHHYAVVANGRMQLSGMLEEALVLYEEAIQSLLKQCSKPINECIACEGCGRD